MGKTKRISILLMIGVILCISTLSTVAADDNSNMTVISPNRDVNLTVSNNNGARFDNYGNDTYNFFNTAQGSTQGMNELHITNDSGNAYGSVVSSNETSGTFYVSNTGGRGWNDAGIIMVAINGTIRDNFVITLNTSGYSWVPVDRSSTPAFSALTYNLVALNETFYKYDFIYGPQIWKPAPGPNNYNVPIFYGQDMNNSTNTFSIMFIDLYAGILKSSLYSGLVDNGMLKVQYTIFGLSGGQMISFNVYGYSNDSNQGQGIRWTNRIVDSGSSGYTVTGTDFTTPTVRASPNTGNYDTVQSVTLTADEPATIYYTTDGSEPTTSSTQYTGPINITTTTTLKFMAVDAAGNQGTTQTETYNIKSDVYVQITPSITNPQVGDQVTYTFKLGNHGPGNASNVVFTYVLPEGVEYAGANVDQGTVNYDPTTRTLTWTVGNVAGGTDPYLWLNLNILSAGTFNIQPTITLDSYNPGLINNIETLQVNAATKKTTNTVNAATTNTIKAGTVPMQTTGTPLAGLILGILCIGSGITLNRKK